MTCRFGLLGTVAVGALLVAGAAQAQLSAEDVWNQWRGYSEGMGQTITVGSESKVGGTLTLQDVVIAALVPEEDITVTMTIGEISLSEQADGRVAISMSDSYPLSVHMPEMAEGDMLEATISHPGLSMTAGGQPGSIQYEFSAPSLTVALTALRAMGEDIPAVFRLGFSQMSGNYLMSDEGIGSIVSETDIGAVEAVVQFEDPSGFSSVDLNASFAGISASSRATGFDLFDPEDIGNALRNGFSFMFHLSSQKSSVNVEVVDWGDETRISTTAAEAGLRIELSRDLVAYSTNSRDVAISLAGDEIPFPTLDISMARNDLWLSLPLSATDAPAQSSVGLRIEDLVLDPEVWEMVDPFGAFPRDPITAIADLTAEVQLSGNVYDDDMMFAMMMFGPMALGELSMVELRELRLSAVGAELTGDGRFTFDNNDMETFPGFPRPTGALNLRLLGGNTLLDKLIDMGMVPADEAMGMRMMLGLFARPGPGEDELTSTLEVREDGAVLANGQRIQ